MCIFCIRVSIFWRICDIYDFFAPYTNVLTYLLTYLLTYSIWFNCSPMFSFLSLCLQRILSSFLIIPISAVSSKFIYFSVQPTLCSALYENIDKTKTFSTVICFGSSDFNKSCQYLKCFLNFTRLFDKICRC